MDYIGGLLADKPCDPPNGADLVQRIERGAAKVEFLDTYPQSLDLTDPTGGTCCHHDLIGNLRQGGDQRLEMRKRKPVLGDEKQDFVELLAQREGLRIVYGPNFAGSDRHSRETFTVATAMAD